MVEKNADFNRATQNTHTLISRLNPPFSRQQISDDNFKKFKKNKKISTFIHFQLLTGAGVSGVCWMDEKIVMYLWLSLCPLY